MKGYSLKECCVSFGVSRQAHNKALKKTRNLEEFEKEVIEKVKEERIEQSKVGTRKLKKHLEVNHNIFIGRDTLFSLLRENRLLVKKRRFGMRTTDSRHGFKRHGNKIKDIIITNPEQVYVSDITYIRVNQIFMYLFLVTDIHSKQIMGYYLGRDMHRNNALKALSQAIKNRVYRNSEIIHHSDCGSQYCSKDYIDLLGKNGFTVSMTEENHCYENSIAERVNGILKSELGLDDIINSEKEAKTKVNKAIKIYNTKRLHLSCEMLTPKQAHMKGGPLKKMWSKRDWKRKKEIGNLRKCGQNETTPTSSADPFSSFHFLSSLNKKG